jgi:cytidine deaminase
MASDLIAEALAAREHSVSPYSHFKVGAAIEAKDGRVFTGCNIESSSYGLTVCAERLALWKALSDGVREFTRIVVVTDAARLTSPCGICRQLLWEYCGDIEVLMHSTRGIDQRLQLAALFPLPFDEGSLSG